MSTFQVAQGFRHLVHRLGDPAEFGVAVSGAVLSADFLAPQTAFATIEQFQSPAWALDFHTAGVKARISGPLEPGWASLGFMRGRTESWFHGHRVHQGVLVCNPPGEGIDGCISPGFESAAINVPRTLWDQCRLLAGADHASFSQVRVHRLTPLTYATMERRLWTARDLLRRADTPEDAHFAARQAAAITVDAATLAWQLSAAPEASADSLRNRARLARRAEAWMREHLDEFLPISAACLALRVSRRELEYAFRSSFDTSPRSFLHSLRLNAIRRALQNNTGDRSTVSEIALNHGVAHFGRFSAQYRALFGENPSETRRIVRLSMKLRRSYPGNS